MERIPYKPSNKLAPRYTPYIGRMLGTNNYAWYFTREFPQHKDPHDRKNKGKICPNLLTKIVDQFHDNVVDALVKNRDGVNLPERLGRLHVYTLISKPSVDDNISGKVGFVVYKTFKETDGKNFSISVEKGTSRYNWSNNGLWNFVATDHNLKKAGDVFRKNVNFFVLSERKNIKKREAKIFFNDVFGKKNELIALETYNEFHVE